MSEPHRPRVYVSGSGRPGDPFVFRDEDEAPVWSAAERRALRLARREMEHDRAIDILSGRKDPD
jgi:hypothetical protein